jgi:molybdopterin-guanine dinucleotide biosynthesis protein B
MHELRGSAELALAEAVGRLSSCDLVLVEGYKRAAIPKLEIWRPSLDKPLLHPDDPHIVAVATDSADRLQAPIPEFRLDDTGAIATFIAEHALRLPPDD